MTDGAPRTVEYYISMSISYHTKDESRTYYRTLENCNPLRLDTFFLNYANCSICYWKKFIMHNKATLKLLVENRPRKEFKLSAEKTSLCSSLMALLHVAEYAGDTVSYAWKDGTLSITINSKSIESQDFFSTISSNELITNNFIDGLIWLCNFNPI